MKNALFLLVLLLYEAQTNDFLSTTFERGSYDPTASEPGMEGPDVPLRDLNTSPNPTPGYDEGKFWGTTLYRGPFEQSLEMQAEEEEPPKKTRKKE